MNSLELEHCLDLEISKTEKRRLEIFMGIVIFSLILSSLNYFAFPYLKSEIFADSRTIRYLFYVGFGFIILLLLSRLLVAKIVTCEKPLPFWYQIYSVSIESAIPGIWLYLVMQREQTTLFLDSPVIFLYIPVIIVSALHLNFWISLLTGAIVTLIYGGLTLWSFSSFNSVTVFPDIVYYTKAAMFLFSGVVAGMVAKELKHRISVSVRSQEKSREIETMFSQQVSREVVDALKSGEEVGIQTHAAVMFLDMRNFTTRVQHMSPKEVNTFQNKFFNPILNAIHDHNGVVNQIFGDGVMATFGPMSGDHYEASAWRAAVQIFNDLKTLNQDLEEPLEIGVGIHSGQVVAGNIGVESRKQFSVSGIPVVIAARLEQLTKIHQASLLVTAPYFRKIRHLVTEFESLGKLEIKGIAEKFEVIKLK